MKDKEDKRGKKPILETGNDGKVFWSKEYEPHHPDKQAGEGSMGVISCGLCGQQKPFEAVRWNASLSKYICAECQEKG